MKPNLLIQLTLVILSLVLLLVAVFFPRRERIVPTEIIIELNDKTTVLRSRGATPTRAAAAPRREDTPTEEPTAPMPPEDESVTDETTYR
jgi:hypothetical protein